MPCLLQVDCLFKGKHEILKCDYSSDIELSNISLIHLIKHQKIEDTIRNFVFNKVFKDLQAHSSYFLDHVPNVITDIKHIEIWDGKSLIFEHFYFD